MPLETDTAEALTDAAHAEVGNSGVPVLIVPVAWCSSIDPRLGPVDVHREAMMAAARWMVAA